MRLKSCAGVSGRAPCGIAVAHDEQRQLGTGHALLDHERAPGVAERLAGQVGAHHVARVGVVVGDEHALALGEAVGLHDVEVAASTRGRPMPHSSSPAPNVA